MNEPFETDHATLLRRNRLVAASPLGLVLGPLVMFIALRAHIPPLAAIAPLAFFTGLVGLIGGRANPWPAHVEGRLVANEVGVFFDGVLLAPRAALRAGFVMPRPDGDGRPAVRLERGILPPIEILVDDETEGRAVLRALGLDASQTVARFGLPSAALASAGGRMLLAAGAGMIGALFGLMKTMFHGEAATLSIAVRVAVLALIVVAAVALRTRLTIGADGVLTSWLGRKRFIAFRDVRSVARYSESSSLSRYVNTGIEITKADGEVVRLPIGQERGAGTEAKASMILERIREAFEAHQRGDAATDTAKLQRGGRDVAAWMRALSAIGAGATADHRTAPVPQDQLWRIVEDPHAEPGARAGAAVVLRESLDETGRSRLRAVASATAQPRVRIALEAAGDCDEAALADALAAVEEPSRSRKQARS